MRKSTMVPLALLLVLPAASFLPPETAPTATQPAGEEAAAAGEAFERIKSLVGEWEAPMEDGVMTNIFRPISHGAAILHEEWLDGEQISATVFYMVGSELRADHFCSIGNQPRFVAQWSADEPNVVTFELLEVLNVDAEPRHFHATTWRLHDSTHHTQDWWMAEGEKELGMVRMEFTRTK